MVSARDIQILTGSGRRAEAAQGLLAAWRGGSVAADDLRGLIHDIWLYVDPPVKPYGPLSVPEWLELFWAVGSSCRDHRSPSITSGGFSTGQLPRSGHGRWLGRPAG